MTIRPMTEDDLDAVIAIENASFSRPWLRRHFLDELASAHAFPLVAIEDAGSIAGYICPTLLLDEGEILDVAVDPVFRGKGIGRILVEAVLRECRERGATVVRLEVRASNEPAIALYGSLGFGITGRRKKYYDNGEDAILMEKALVAE